MKTTQIIQETANLIREVLENRKMMSNIFIYSKGEELKVRVNTQIYDSKEKKFKNFELYNKIDLNHPIESKQNIKNFITTLRKAINEN